MGGVGGGVGGLGGGGHKKQNNKKKKKIFFFCFLLLFFFCLFIGVGGGGGGLWGGGWGGWAVRLLFSNIGAGPAYRVVWAFGVIVRWQARKSFQAINGAPSFPPSTMRMGKASDAVSCRANFDFELKQHLSESNPGIDGDIAWFTPVFRRSTITIAHGDGGPPAPRYLREQGKRCKNNQNQFWDGSNRAGDNLSVKRLMTMQSGSQFPASSALVSPAESVPTAWMNGKIGPHNGCFLLTAEKETSCRRPARAGRLRNSAARISKVRFVR